MMINIKLVFYGYISEQIGLGKKEINSTLDLQFEDGSSVQDVIIYISEAYPGFREIGLKKGTSDLSWNMAILLNGSICSRDSFCSTILNDDDKLVLIPVYAGG